MQESLKLVLLTSSQFLCNCNILFLYVINPAINYFFIRSKAFFIKYKKQSVFPHTYFFWGLCSCHTDRVKDSDNTCSAEGDPCTARECKVLHLLWKECDRSVNDSYAYFSALIICPTTIKCHHIRINLHRCGSAICCDRKLDNKRTSIS